MLFGWKFTVQHLKELTMQQKLNLGLIRKLEVKIEPDVSTSQKCVLGRSEVMRYKSEPLKTQAMRSCRELFSPSLILQYKTSRERPKSAPYLTLKNIQGTTIVNFFNQHTVPKITRKGFPRVSKTAFFLNWKHKKSIW